MFNLVPDIITEYWLGNKNKKKKQSTPAQKFKNFCESNPWAPECKEYDV